LLERHSVERLKKTIPGDRLAVIEEFSPSEGTYIDRDTIRATKVGVKKYDSKRKEVKIEVLQKARKMAMVGDSVIGQVEAVQSNIANVRIHYINDKRSLGGFTGMLLLRSDNRHRRDRKKSLMLKSGDIIRARVTSYMNAIIHLSIDDNENGVMYTTCSSCGGMVRGLNQGVECVDCGFVEDRKLAADFGRAHLK